MKIFLPLLLLVLSTAFGSTTSDCLGEYRSGGLPAYEKCLEENPDAINVLDDVDALSISTSTKEPCAGTYEECEGKEEEKVQFIPPFKCREICERAFDVYTCYEQLCPEVLFDL